MSEWDRYCRNGGGTLVFCGGARDHGLVGYRWPWWSLHLRQCLICGTTARRASKRSELLLSKTSGNLDAVVLVVLRIGFHLSAFGATFGTVRSTLR